MDINQAILKASYKSIGNANKLIHRKKINEDESYLNELLAKIYNFEVVILPESLNMKNQKTIEFHGFE